MQSEEGQKRKRQRWNEGWIQRLRYSQRITEKVGRKNWAVTELGRWQTGMINTPYHLFPFCCCAETPHQGSLQKEGFIWACGYRVHHHGDGEAWPLAGMVTRAGRTAEYSHPNLRQHRGSARQSRPPSDRLHPSKSTRTVPPTIKMTEICRWHHPNHRIVFIF